MSRFKKLSQAVWHCHYHIIWCPKYRFKILTGSVAEEVSACIRIFSERQGCEVTELNVQIDHVHLLVLIPPKVSVSEFVGRVKGKTAIHPPRNGFPSYGKNPTGETISGQKDIALTQLALMQR